MTYKSKRALPLFAYKYLSPEIAIKLLEMGALSFSRASDLRKGTNKMSDKTEFSFSAPLKYDYVKIREKLEHLSKLGGLNEIISHKVLNNKKKFRKVVREFLKASKTWGQARGWRILDEHFRVCCLSSLSNDPYLWNTAAENKTGICLKINIGKIKDVYSEKYLKYVKYKKNRPFFTNLYKIEFNNLSKILYTKLKKYSNEAEIRLVTTNINSIVYNTNLVNTSNENQRVEMCSTDEYNYLDIIHDTNYKNAVSARNENFKSETISEGKKEFLYDLRLFEYLDEIIFGAECAKSTIDRIKEILKTKGILLKFSELQSSPKS